MSFAHLHTCTLAHNILYSVSCKSYLIFIFILFFVIGCFMSTMYNLLHIPLCTVMLILIFNSTAYCHAHSFTFYILFFISYFSFILSYVYFPCVVFSIFALSMERTRLSFHCWLYSLCIVVYVTNKTWNLKWWSHQILTGFRTPGPPQYSKTAHFRVAFYCGQPKAHLCNNHAV